MSFVLKFIIHDETDGFLKWGQHIMAMGKAGIS